MKKILQTFLILIAFGIEAKSQTMLTIAQVYDFNINDEFQYRYYDLDYNNYGSFPNRTRYKIVNKYYSALNDTVFYIRLFDNYRTQYNPSPSPHMDYFFDTYTDTIFYTNLDTLINAEIQNLPTDTNGNWHNDTLFYSTWMCGKLIYEYNICYNCIFEGTSINVQLGEGLGLVQSQTQCPAWPQVDDRCYLLFYKKDSVECGERDTTDISVNIIENNSENSYNKIFVYPNSTTNKLTIQAPQNSTIKITNIEGQIIKTFINNNIETTIDVSDCSPGVYIIKAQTEKGVVIKKFIKQ